MFIDTNVLVNARIADAPDHQTARARLERASQDIEPMRISRQVLREYLSAMTRPGGWTSGIRLGEALEDVSRFITAFEVLEDGPVVTEWLIALCRDASVGGRQVHDANIVATMLAHGERRLVTFNTADFRRYGDRIELVGS